MELAIVDALRARIGGWLERGAGDSSLLRLAAATWSVAAADRIARPLAIPRGLKVIGIGSAVLGGAGKTPIAIAVARSLATAGAKVALVSHAYRAKPGRSREVGPESPVGEVGDDALASAKSLVGAGVAVFVGPTRAGAIDLAASRGAEIVIVDGLLQSAPSRLAASVLVLDGSALWGSGACPPIGDLRAPRDALLAATDLVAVVRSENVRKIRLDPSVPAIDVPTRTLGAVGEDGSRVTLTSLANTRVGLFVAVARPDRITAELARRGVALTEVITLADHARMNERALARARSARVDVWLTTSRCATKLPAFLGRAPILALAHEVDVAALLHSIEARLDA